MRCTLVTFWILFVVIGTTKSQNQNVSGGFLFEGEPYLSINPNNDQHLVVAWMGYEFPANIAIKTKVSLDGGDTWSSASIVEHESESYSSADPCLQFDHLGNVFLSYIDYNRITRDSGAVYLRKSSDGGLNWEEAVEVINMQFDADRLPIDRPWMSIDKSGGINEGNIYITTMNAQGASLPFHPHVMVSNNGGNSFEVPRYLDTTSWLSGDLIPQPMPTNTVSSSGMFHAVYPSYVFSQNFLPQYILASSINGGISFNYQSILQSTNLFADSLAKKGYLLIADPSNQNHLAFLYLANQFGDGDVYFIETFDEGINWTVPLRINDDAAGNDKMQDLVWADFDEDGDLIVAWRDRRNASGSTYETESEIWAAYRHKDSLSFGPNFSITDQLVSYDSILAESGNDFMCVKLRNDTLYAVWGDVRTGVLNIWFQRMSIDGAITSIKKIVSEEQANMYIYPNPTSNKIFLHGENIQSLQIFDGQGTLVYQSNNVGHTNVLNIEHFNSGTYYVVIYSGNNKFQSTVVKK